MSPNEELGKKRRGFPLEGFLVLDLETYLVTEDTSGTLLIW